MIRSIIRFSAEHRGLVLGATLVALLAAFWSMKAIALDALPEELSAAVAVDGREPRLERA